MLKFYDVDEKYVKFLQSHDNQIPNISYTNNNKFLCGIIATIRFCFMFPVPLAYVTEKDFSKIRKRDSAYADLLLKEWRDCDKNELAILTKAESIYKIGCNKSHPFNYTCCDFKLLEREYMKFKP